MTVTQLRKLLEEMEKEGRGDFTVEKSSDMEGNEFYKVCQYSIEDEENTITLW